MPHNLGSRSSSCSSSTSISEQFDQILFTSELPEHVSASPQAGVSLCQRLLECISELAEHPLDVKFSIDQVILIGREHDGPPGDALYRIDARGG